MFLLKSYVLIPALFGLLAIPAASGYCQEGSKQEPKADAGLEAMQKLSAMVGEWEGSGSMRMGSGEPAKMRSTESVEFGLDGRIMVVKGLHFDHEDPTRVVHNALAIVSYNKEAGHYRFQSWLADGRQGDYEMKIDGESIIWSMDGPGRKIRYTINIKDSVWKEIGEFSTDGKKWMQFFEMELDKKE